MSLASSLSKKGSPICTTEWSQNHRTIDLESEGPSETRGSNVFILQIRKLWLRELSGLPEGYTATKELGWDSDLIPPNQNPIFFLLKRIKLGLDKYSVKEYLLVLLSGPSGPKHSSKNKASTVLKSHNARLFYRKHQGPRKWVSGSLTGTSTRRHLSTAVLCFIWKNNLLLSN